MNSFLYESLLSNWNRSTWLTYHSHKWMFFFSFTNDFQQCSLQRCRISLQFIVLWWNEYKEHLYYWQQICLSANQWPLVLWPYIYGRIKAKHLTIWFLKSFQYQTTIGACECSTTWRLVRWNTSTNGWCVHNRDIIKRLMLCIYFDL